MERNVTYNICLLFLLTLFVVMPLAAEEMGGDKASIYPTAPTDVHPIIVGTSVPVVSLKSSSGQPFDLAAAIADKPTVLVFYRGWW